MAENTLTLYSDITPREVKWIWYPYIPAGKITILQGDPGDGKSTMMMHLIAEISKGGNLPDGREIGRPHRVIYQCSEDGVRDTIRPRLERCGADLSNIAFIDEEVHTGLTLDDERIREAIVQFRPWLVVMDPIQSYVENVSDLIMATNARRLMKRISLWASAYGCAIILVGHLNKNERSKGLYRGLGSIDVAAAARSILHIERIGDERIVRQIKNNLAPAGKDFGFLITRDTGFQWIETGINDEPDDDELMDGLRDISHNKHELTAMLLMDLLDEGEASASDVKDLIAQYCISDKTLQEVKSFLGIKSIRRNGKWYWQAPGSPGKGEKRWKKS